MKLSIITINYNDAAGLKKTFDSVLSQTVFQGVEHVIVDGGSSDNSVPVIEEYAASAPYSVLWVSEKDNGIYNAMNKGIRMASGDYIQILNAGDVLASNTVVEEMYKALLFSQEPELLYGNMTKVTVDGKIIGKSREVEYSLRNYYSGTMNHDCCYIRRSLFEEYGLYDESLKIVSDWKWFLEVIGLGRVRPVYVDIDVTIFDAGGISETNLELRNRERRQVLEAVLPPAVLADYDAHAFDAEQMDRLRRHHLYRPTWFKERVLFKLEKWGILKK